MWEPIIKNISRPEYLVLYLRGKKIGRVKAHDLWLFDFELNRGKIKGAALFQIPLIRLMQTVNRWFHAPSQNHLFTCLKQPQKPFKKFKIYQNWYQNGVNVQSHHRITLWIILTHNFRKIHELNELIMVKCGSTMAFQRIHQTKL